MKRLLSVLAAGALVLSAGCSSKNSNSGPVELDGKVYDREFTDKTFSQLTGDIQIGGASFALPCTLMDITGDFSFMGFVNENETDHSKRVVLGVNGQPAASVTVESEHNDSDLTDNAIIEFSANSDTASANPDAGKISVGGICLGDSRELVERCFGKPAQEQDVGDRIVWTYTLEGSQKAEFQFGKDDNKAKEITLHT